MPHRFVPAGAWKARYEDLVYDRVLMNTVRERFARDGARAIDYERRRAAAMTADERRDGALPLLASIVAPTLLVWGEHDKHVPLAWAEALRERIAHATLVVMPGVAHLPHYEAPAEFAALVNEFLAT